MKKLIDGVGTLIASTALSSMLMVPWAHSASQLTAAEIAMLPDYCQARWAGKDTAAFKSWKQRLGASNFIHIHHFCIGLHFMNKAPMEFDAKEKKFMLQKAVRNFDYVLARWPKHFSMTSEASVHRQQAKMMLSLTR